MVNYINMLDTLISILVFIKIPLCYDDLVNMAAMINTLHFGPNLKNIQTHIMEAYAKLALASPVKVKINADKHYQYRLIGTYGKSRFNLSDIMRECQYENLSLNANDSDLFFSNGNDLFMWQRPIAEKYSVLTKAEKGAIFYYSGYGYLPMNDMLYGNISAIIGEQKNRFLMVMFTSSGLNKLPSELNHAESYRNDRCYRGEFKQRIRSIGNGELSTIASFVSTSYNSKPGNFCFSLKLLAFSRRVHIRFLNTTGKLIDQVAKDNSERELLITPGTKIQWHEYNAKTNEFTASAVRPLETISELTPYQIILLSDLCRKLEKKNIDLDFVAPHLKPLLPIVKDNRALGYNASPDLISFITSTYGKLQSAQNVLKLSFVIGATSIIAGALNYASVLISIGLLSGGVLSLGISAGLLAFKCQHLDKISNYIKQSKTLKRSHKSDDQTINQASEIAQLSSLLGQKPVHCALAFETGRSVELQYQKGLIYGAAAQLKSFWNPNAWSPSYYFGKASKVSAGVA